MLSNNKKSSPLPLPLRELKDAEVFLNAPGVVSEIKENIEPNQLHQCVAQASAKKFKAPIVKTAGMTTAHNYQTDIVRSNSVVVSAPIKRFTPSFKAGPQTNKTDDSGQGPSTECKRYFKVMFAK